jgi:ribosome modulation factor
MKKPRRGQRGHRDPLFGEHGFQQGLNHGLNGREVKRAGYSAKSQQPSYLGVAAKAVARQAARWKVAFERSGNSSFFDS